MIRCRFKANENDFRPVNWPVKHPYWCTGYGDGFSIVVAYADDESEIMRNWPEARDLDSTGVSEYTFTSRFPKPEWFTQGELDAPPGAVSPGFHESSTCDGCGAPTGDAHWNSCKWRGLVTANQCVTPGE